MFEWKIKISQGWDWENTFHNEGTIRLRNILKWKEYLGGAYDWEVLGAEAANPSLSSSGEPQMPC